MASWGGNFSTPSYRALTNQATTFGNPSGIDPAVTGWERQLKNDAIMRERDISQQAAMGENAYGLQERGANANQSRLWDSLSRLGIGPDWLNSMFRSSTGGGDGGARVSGDDAAYREAEAAAMGRAKDQAAAAVGAAKKSIDANAVERGIFGSGIQGKNLRAAELAGAGQIGEAARTQAMGAAQRAGQVSDRNYAGNITQRGQDIQAAGQKMSLLPSLMSLFRISASY